VRPPPSFLFSLLTARSRRRAVLAVRVLVPALHAPRVQRGRAVHRARRALRVPHRRAVPPHARRGDRGGRVHHLRRACGGPAGAPAALSRALCCTCNLLRWSVGETDLGLL
jgi:hypothetical protein